MSGCGPAGTRFPEAAAAARIRADSAMLLPQRNRWQAARERWHAPGPPRCESAPMLKGMFADDSGIGR